MRNQCVTLVQLITLITHYLLSNQIILVSQATTLGAAMSLCAMIIMALLFSAETLAFAKSQIVTEIAMDDNTATKIQLNFNITLYALQCDYVSVDVWDVLGTNRQNVTKNIEKW